MRVEHALARLGVEIELRDTLRSPEHARELVDTGKRLQAELEDVIGDGVMLFPSYTSVAPHHNQPLRTPWHVAYTAIINVMELPSTQVPLGLNDRGVPLGVQVVGKRGNDHVTIAVALELERAFGGWVAPT